MSITEKAAYLKGLAKGLEIDESTKEGKLLLALVDAVELMADEIADVQEACDELDEVVDVLDEDLTELEEDFLEIFGEDEDDDDCGCGHDHHHDEEEGDLYEIVCPSCEDQIYLDESMLEVGSIECPSCGEHLEFEAPEDEEEPESEEV